MRSLTCAQVFLLYTHTHMYFERFPPLKRKVFTACLSASTLGSAGVIQTWCRRRRRRAEEASMRDWVSEKETLLFASPLAQRTYNII